MPRRPRGHQDSLPGSPGVLDKPPHLLLSAQDECPNAKRTPSVGLSVVFSGLFSQKATESGFSWLIRSPD